MSLNIKLGTQFHNCLFTASALNATSYEGSEQYGDENINLSTYLEQPITQPQHREVEDSVRPH